jgi:CBS domain-containing protein
MQAYDVMTWGVISVEADAPVIRAALLMLEHKTSVLPVLDKNGRLVGVVTAGDFIHRGEIGNECGRPSWLKFLIGPGRLTTEYARVYGRKVSEIMTPNPCSAACSTALEEVVQLMETHRIKSLPIIEDDQVIGMVNWADLMRAFIGLGRERNAQVGTDTAVGRDILDERHSQTLAPQINATVGNNELQGVVTESRERQASTVATMELPDVKGYA